MKTKILPNIKTLKKLSGKTLLVAVTLLLSIISNTANATNNKSSVTDGNWSDPNTWSPNGVPASDDNVTIKGGDTVTVDGTYTCADLSVGNSNAAGATLKITSASNSLTTTGVFNLNPNSRAYTFALDAGPGAININGTFSTWGTSGTNKFMVSTGSMTFTPAVSITSSSAQQIVFNGAGTITFNGAFSDKYNKLTTYSGCTVNFGSSYTATTTTANWNGNGTAIFTGSASSITPTSSITFNNVQVAASKSLTLNSGGGTVIMGSVTLGSGSTFTTNKDFEITGNWTNNGGTFSGGTYTTTLNGSGSQTIGGTSSTSFYNLSVGKTSGTIVTVSYTMNSSASCNKLTFTGTTLGRTLTLSSGTTLTISDSLNINQPTIAGITNLLDVGAGTCTVGGNLSYIGANATSTKVAKVNVTTGSFTVSGTINWMANTVTATEVLAVSTGTVAFGSAVSMLTGSGTMQATGAATMNFNGTSGASLTFGGVIAPTFSTVSGTTVNFANGYTNLVTSPSFASGTNVNVGSPSSPVNITIDPGTTLTNNGNAIIYGDLTSSAGSTFVNAANATLEVRGSISSNVTLTATASGNTVKYSGTSAQTVKPISYVNLTVANSAGISTSSGTTTVSGVLNLSSGKITTTSSNILKLAAGASVTGGSASSYIDGPVTKVGNTDFTFPTGKSGQWMRVGISGLTSATTEVTAEYFSGAYSDVTTMTGSVTQVSTVEYWDVSRAVTSDPVKLKFYWEDANASGIVDCSGLKIAHYTSGRWQEEPATVDNGSTCGSGTGSITMTGTVTTFSPFGFGGGGGALPVKLVSFMANVDGSVVKTNWTTELEINNAFFNVERSDDGINFTDVAKIDGAGNSTSQLSYESIDKNPMGGTSYYRLKQTDFDGQFSYSDVVAVSITDKSEFSFRANPTDNELFLNVTNPSSEVKVIIYDMSGRRMFYNVYPVDNESHNSVITVNVKYLLPTGIYMVNAISNGREHREKVILK